MARAIGHFKAIDGLRAWMAWWVVLQHTLQLGGMKGEIPSPIYTLLTSGGVAVDVFIIVSGYVICHLILTERESYWPYIIRRFFRIYPLYVVAVTLSIILRNVYAEEFSLYPWIAGSTERMERFAAENADFAQHIGLHITLLHGVPPDNLIAYSSTAFLAPAWSLSLEWQFYLVAPLLLLMWQRGARAFSIAGISLALALYSQLGPWKWELSSNLFLSLGFFFLGISTRYAMQFGLKSGLLPLALMAANFALSICRLGMHFVYFELSLALIIWALAILAIYIEIGAIAAESKFGNIYSILFSGKHAVEVGKWSYSTYLLHIPLFTIAVYLANRLGFDGRYCYVAAMLLAAPLLLWLSKLSYQWIEKPSIRAGKMIAERLAKKNLQGISR